MLTKELDVGIVGTRLSVSPSLGFNANVNSPSPSCCCGATRGSESELSNRTILYVLSPRTNSDLLETEDFKRSTILSVLSLASGFNLLN